MRKFICNVFTKYFGDEPEAKAKPAGSFRDRFRGTDATKTEDKGAEPPPAKPAEAPPTKKAEYPPGSKLGAADALRNRTNRYPVGPKASSATTQGTTTVGTTTPATTSTTTAAAVAPKDTPPPKKKKIAKGYESVPGVA